MNQRVMGALVWTIGLVVSSTIVLFEVTRLPISLASIIWGSFVSGICATFAGVLWYSIFEDYSRLLKEKEDD